MAPAPPAARSLHQQQTTNLVTECLRLSHAICIAVRWCAGSVLGTSRPHHGGPRWVCRLGYDLQASCQAAVVLAGSLLLPG